MASQAPLCRPKSEPRKGQGAEMSKGCPEQAYTGSSYCIVLLLKHFFVFFCAQDSCVAHSCVVSCVRKNTKRKLSVAKGLCALCGSGLSVGRPCRRDCGAAHFFPEYFGLLSGPRHACTSFMHLCILFIYFRFAVLRKTPRAILSHCVSSS